MRFDSFILNELANRPYSYHLVEKIKILGFPEKFVYEYTFKTDQNVGYIVELVLFKNAFSPGKTLHVGYGLKRDSEPQGDQFRVLSTVLDILKKFLSMTDDSELRYISIGFSDLRRQKFYSRFASYVGKYLPGWELKDQGTNYFTFKRLDNINESSIEGILVDLTQNYQNYRSLVGQILGQDTNGKLRIKIVSADPKTGMKSLVNVGDVIKLSPHYLKKAKVVENENLTEVKMSPNELRRWAAGSDSKQVKVGFEFEMVFPDTPRSDSDENAEFEPNYDMDESVSLIEDIISFFSDGDNPISYRQANSLRQQLRDGYNEWIDEQAKDEWSREDFEDWMHNNYRDELIEEFTADAARELGFDVNTGDRDEERKISQLAEEKYETQLDDSWDQEDEYYNEGFNEFVDGFKNDHDEQEWLNGEGIDTMRDAASVYNLEWPHQIQISSVDWEQAWNAWAKSLGRAIGGDQVIVSGSYHGIERNYTNWILEYDSSISPNSSEDAGIEVISPPMPLDEALEKLEKVLNWANDNGIYTNESTGLHINISTMRYGIDYVKMILFMGDQYILDQFGRAASSFAKSAMQHLLSSTKIARDRDAVSEAQESVNNKPIDIAAAMELMRKNLIELASHYVQQGVGSDKYMSAHIRHTSAGQTFIEFRGPGNDYLESSSLDENIIDNTVLRLARAMVIAGEPSYERKEYGKKLYRLLTGTRFKSDDQGKTTTGEVETDDAIAQILADYAAGTETADSIKRRWSTEVLTRYRQDRIKGIGDSKEYEVYLPDTEEVVDRFTATSDKDALEKAQSVHSGKGYNYTIRVADGQLTPRQQLAKKILGVPRLYYVAPKENNVWQKGIYIEATDANSAVEQARNSVGDSWQGILKMNISAIPLGLPNEVLQYKVSHPNHKDFEIDVYADTPEKAIEVARHEAFRNKNDYKDNDFVILGGKIETTPPQLKSKVKSIADPTLSSVPRQPSVDNINMPGPGESNYLVHWNEYRERNGERVMIGDMIRIVARSAEDASRRLIDSLQVQGRNAFSVTAAPTDTPAWQQRRATAGEPIPGSTQDIQRQRQQGEFTGAWRVVNRAGEEVHRFSGAGNSQGDANRTAQTWLITQGDRMNDQGPFDVVPVMQ